jgi:hypothetical protein
MISVLSSLKLTAQYIEYGFTEMGSLWPPEKNIFWDGRDEIFPEGKEFSGGNANG